MALTTLATIAKEGSTFVVTCTFTDETGAAATPTALTWTLTDLAGTVINSRQDEEVASPSASVDIVLSGDDLAVSGKRQTTRVLTLEGTYDSDAGTGLPINDAALIKIDPLPGVIDEA